MHSDILVCIFIAATVRAGRETFPHSLRFAHSCAAAVQKQYSLTAHVHRDLQSITMLNPKFLTIIFAVICVQWPHPSYSDSSIDGCFSSALNWIEETEVKDTRVLESHAQASCKSAEKWINGYGGKESSRKRLCNDLILIWTHKECIYFRDYVSHTAYTPCKSWSREMYKRCVDYDDGWFAN